MNSLNIAELSLNDKKGSRMEAAIQCTFEICLDNVTEQPKSNPNYCNVCSPRQDNKQNKQGNHSSENTPVNNRSLPLQTNKKRSSFKGKCFPILVPKKVTFAKHIEIREYYCPKENRSKKVIRKKKKRTRLL